MKIEQPGIYNDVPDEEYHRDPYVGGSLSSTEARRILDSPARYRWWKDNGPEHSDVFDFGKAAHNLVLGAGAPIDKIDADDWRTKAAREARDESRAAGRVPILAADYQVVEAMAAAIQEHPVARALLDPHRGRPEVSLFWHHQTGVACRARVDLFPDVDAGRRLILGDYKTCANASNAAFSKAAASYGYHLQADWYLEGVRTLCGVDDPAFVFIAQEKTPPYLVNVVELDATAMQIAHDRNRQAIDTFVACSESGEWPGYPTEVQQIALPRWVQIQHEEEQDNAQF